ncbi:unnamed protein product, partial [Rotaria sordida]
MASIFRHGVRKHSWTEGRNRKAGKLECPNTSSDAKPVKGTNGGARNKQHGAHVNAESLPGGQEYLSLTDPSVIDIHRTNDSVPHGRTPLHIVCTREATEDTLSL